MYLFGQALIDDRHFQDHLEHDVPIQIYCGQTHSDIGFIETYGPEYVKVNNTFYSRTIYTFISRPGY